MGEHLFYFAQPIDGRFTHEQKAALASHVSAARLAAENRPSVTLFLPSKAYQPGREGIASGINEINRLALRRCDGVLAILPDGVPSIGVPIEINDAVKMAKPVVVIGGGMMDSAILRGLNVPVFHRVQAEAAVARLCAKVDERAAIVEYGNLLRRDKPNAAKFTPAPEVQVAVKRLHTASQMPTKAHDDDCGYDLYVIGDHTLLPGDKIDLPCGVAMEFPEGAWGLLVGRSSALRKLGLRVLPGIIDNGYRGELFAFVENATTERVVVNHGQRIAQIIPLPTMAANWGLTEVEELSESARGVKGFGSSGH